MPYHWDLTYQLAGHLDSGNRAGAVALLHEQAEHFISQSESRGGCTIGNIWLQRRARWLIHAVNALPELEKAEAKVREERTELRGTDAGLVSAVAALQKHIADCASVAAHLTKACLPPASHCPAQPGSRSYFYVSPLSFSPLSYLRSFAGPRPPYRYRYGKPVLHAAIESEDHDCRLFLSVAMDNDWQCYFYECLAYFARLFESAQTYLPIRKLLEVSKLNAETGIGGFSKDRAAPKIDEIRKLYLQRAATRERVGELLDEIDYFYECLKCCEQRFYIAPAFLPSFAPARFLGCAPLGMPFYADMHPENSLKPYTSLAFHAVPELLPAPDL